MHHVDPVGFNALCPLVGMMHECSPGESARQGCIHASCRPYGVDTLPKGRHDAWMQPWWADSPGLHSCIMTTNGHNALKHYAALKGLTGTQRPTQGMEVFMLLLLGSAHFLTTGGGRWNFARMRKKIWPPLKRGTNFSRPPRDVSENFWPPPLIYSNSRAFSLKRGEIFLPPPPRGVKFFCPPPQRGPKFFCPPPPPPLLKNEHSLFMHHDDQWA